MYFLFRLKISHYVFYLFVPLVTFVIATDVT